MITSMDTRTLARGSLFVGVLTTFALIATLTAGQQPAGERGGQGRGGGEPGNSKPVAWLGNKVPNLHPVDQHLTDSALVEAIDLHAHLNPDSSGGGQEPRAIDVIEDAQQMKARGARGFVYKTHMDTAPAYHTRRVNYPV